MKINLAITFLLIGTLNLFAQVGPERDTYGGFASIKGNATGWFHVEQIEGRWFFVTPDGHAFFSLGVTHTGETIKQDELNILQSKYRGDDVAMGHDYLQHLCQWGYNSVGYGPFESIEKEIPYVATIWTEGPRSKSAGTKSLNTDIFDLDVQQRLRMKVRAAAARHVSNPYCLGYVFIDLPIWNLKPDPGPNYVEFIRSLPKDSAGQKALAKYREEHVAADDEAMLNHIAETYYECVVAELRNVDAHHLILGDRFMAAAKSQTNLRTPDSILETASRFVDVISFQPMGTQQPIKSYLDQVTQLTGKPILLADVNTMTMRPSRDQVDTTDYEQAAGEHTMAYYLDAASSPACVGIHRCTLRDFQPWNPQYHRRGLLRADDTPYARLVDDTVRTNQQVYALVYRMKDYPLR